VSLFEGGFLLSTVVVLDRMDICLTRCIPKEQANPRYYFSVLMINTRGKKWNHMRRLVRIILPLLFDLNLPILFDLNRLCYLIIVVSLVLKAGMQGSPNIY
jgi:hypothetical protein